MITSAERRQPPILVIALTLSLLVHLLGLLFYAGFAHKWLVAVQKVAHKVPDEQMAATTDTITLDKPVPPNPSRPSVRSPRQPLPPQPLRPPPQPAVEPQPEQPKVVQAPPRPRTTLPPTPEPTVVPTPIVRREIAHVVPRGERQPTPTATKPPNEERKIAYAPPQRQTAPNQKAPHALTADQIAAYQQQFKQTIASAQADVINGRPQKRPPATIKKYEMQMAGRLKDLQSAQGLVEPLTDMRFDRAHQLDIWYIRVHMVYSDGYTEVADIPWPVVFPSRNDPIRFGNREFHGIPPPPGWTLPHPFQLSRIVCIYFRDECQAVIDAEQKNGGLPAGATMPPG